MVVADAGRAQFHHDGSAASLGSREYFLAAGEWALIGFSSISQQRKVKEGPLSLSTLVPPGSHLIGHSLLPCRMSRPRHCQKPTFPLLPVLPHLKVPHGSVPSRRKRLDCARTLLVQLIVWLRAHRRHTSTLTVARSTLHSCQGFLQRRPPLSPFKNGSTRSSSPCLPLPLGLSLPPLSSRLQDYPSSLVYLCRSRSTLRRPLPRRR